jgi:hypothetical protein
MLYSCEQQCLRTISIPRHDINYRSLEFIALADGNFRLHMNGLCKWWQPRDITHTYTRPLLERILELHPCGREMFRISRHDC